MNIGILTYHCVPNFGAQLQVLSTVECVKSLGHTPFVLNWYPKDLEEMYSHRICKEQILCHNFYTGKYLPVTSLCQTEKDLLKAISDNKIDFILTGSDALFKYVPKAKRKYFSLRKFRYITQNVISCEDFPNNPFFCDYYESLENKIPVVALSVSSQNCPYNLMNEKERYLIGESLKRFKKITVRDEWTKEMVEFLTDISDIKVSPDPVFAFNNNCNKYVPSKNEILEKFSLPDKYVLLSFSNKYVSNSYISSVITECKKQKLYPVALPMPESLRDFGLDNTIKLPLSPIDWYALIKYSCGYIGERMHPIVVCLHNSVPFYSFDEYGVIKRHLGGLVKKVNIQSSKTYHIVKKFGFLNNLYSIKSGQQPTAKEIVENLFSFDKNKCNMIAKKTSEEFISTITELICKKCQP